MGKVKVNLPKVFSKITSTPWN